MHDYNSRETKTDCSNSDLSTTFFNNPFASKGFDKFAIKLLVNCASNKHYKISVVIGRLEVLKAQYLSQ